VTNNIRALQAISYNPVYSNPIDPGGKRLWLIQDEKAILSGFRARRKEWFLWFIVVTLNLMRTLWLIALCSVVVTVSFPGTADKMKIPAIRPAPRTDANSRIAHEQLVGKAKKGGIDVYFMGDSITRRWGATDPQYKELLKNWTTNFFGWNAGNFGWGADKIENILWRLENGELEGVDPKIIVILAGINDVGTEPAGNEKSNYIAAGVKTILDACRQKAPAATIIVTAIFPRNDNMAVIPVIDAANRKIAKFADGKRIRFVDINRKLADEKGKFFEGMVNTDKVHPTVKTYQVWADALKPILTEILGPRASTDHAPPPTGDPSVNKK
jgi:lysophospholipase L1-like esterase